jgi:hypothetical protein
MSLSLYLAELRAHPATRVLSIRCLLVFSDRTLSWLETLSFIIHPTNERMICIVGAEQRLDRDVSSGLKQAI